MPHQPLFALPLIALIAFVSIDSASAQQQKHKPQKPSAHEATSTPVLRSPSHNPCAQYGAGFTRVPGSDTCARIGGYVGVDVGGRF